MKIGFDAKRAFHNGSGLGNYARNLLRSLAVYHPEDRYHLFSPSIKGSLFPEAAEATTAYIKHTPEGLHKSFSGLWRSFGITQDLNTGRLDIFHGLSNELPYSINRFKGKKVVTIHDLIFIRYPELYPGFDRAIYHAKVGRSCSDADVVVAISEQTKQDLIQFLNVPVSKIRVVYQSCDQAFFNAVLQDEKEQIRIKYNLPTEYLLYVGTIEERKNLALIIDALAKGISLPLVVIGKKRAYFQQVMQRVQSLGLEKQVIFLADVSSLDIPALYQMAKVFIYPSRFEGFGIPIIEALASKVPVITTAGGVFPEAGGPSSRYIHPDRADQLAHAINQICENKDLQEEMVAAGWNHVQRFHPKQTAADMHALYRSLL